LSKQKERIASLEGFKSGLEVELSTTYLHQNYTFQNTPEGTVAHLFESAKNADYSKLRDIIDPYGEFDGDVLRIGIMEAYSNEEKELFKLEFLNGRIMGEPKVNGAHAEVEIAIGVSSNRLENIELINREGKWYLASF
jgi:hypothetical protein